MIKIISNEGCTNCQKVKKFMEDNNIQFEYTLINDLPRDLKKEYKHLAQQANQTVYPIIIEDDKLIDFKNIEQQYAIKVNKRNGKIVLFDKSRIINAITNAMLETEQGVDESLAKSISDTIYSSLKEKNISIINVEELQDIVEDNLMNSRKDVAKRYILYRNQKDNERAINVKTTQYKLLTDEFISKYKHSPNPMKQLGTFVYYRTYSRWLPEKQRREFWWETVRRAVEYNCSLNPNTTKEEAEELYDNIFNLRQFLSGRTFWVGGTEVAYKYPMANYNCAFEVIDNMEAFSDLFYLLMLGTGFGFRPIKVDIDKLPKLRTNIDLIHKDYTPVPKNEREDSTSIIFKNNHATIIVGDSKEGWVQALSKFLEILYNKDYKKINTVIISYDNVRPKGERLKTFGGTASGHESIKNMFAKIFKVLQKSNQRQNSNIIKLEGIDCLDICNIIGENVVVGGVRRTAENCICAEDDTVIIQAKNSLYTNVNGQWIEDKEISHRKMSNNSILYEKKPTREQLHWHVEQMRYTGEPGFANAEAARKRRDNFNGLNPCFEILLDSRGMCNLTTVNVFSFVENGKLNREKLLLAQKLSTRAGYRMTNVDLELYKWDYIQKRDRLIGCSLTGWQDMVDAIDLSKEEQAKLLRELRDITHESANEIATEIGGNVPVLSTTVKPEGTLSLLPTVSSGLHYSHSEYYIRRVRINANDPLCKVCEELQYPIHPEVGQDIETCSTKVIEFPIHAPVKRTKYDVSAIEQLENYKMFMDNYVDHNASITITVKNDEWDGVEQWLWDNWDDVLATSFLSLTDAVYPLMPYEAITKEEYEKRLTEMKPFMPSLLQKYEKQETEFDLASDGECSTGACPIR